jgi:hypothetical protein
MKRIYAKHEPYTTGQLGDIVQELEIYGPPTIRCAVFKDSLFAVEGSHRLAGCSYLGLEPKIVIEDNYVDGLENFWEEVIPKLPFYEFEHVHILDLDKMSERV